VLASSLRDAVAALVRTTFYRKAFGEDVMIDYLVPIKRAEPPSTRSSSRG